ncbi:MAG: hypothetical protein PHH77_05475 [Victivallaceae bacterium]|nr:hypothetical protein [Victivallaceae bacterium]
MKRTNFIGMAAAVIIAAVMSGGCGTAETASLPPGQLGANDVFKQMQEDFKRMKDPESAVGMMREYALEKLPNATDEELAFLQGTPVVQPNYNGTLYAFFWKRSSGKGIQVLATPPPCKPIEVFRTRRVKFP